MFGSRIYRRTGQGEKEAIKDLSGVGELQKMVLKWHLTLIFKMWIIQMSNVQVCVVACLKVT